MNPNICLEYPGTRLGVQAELFVATDVLTFSERLQTAVQNALYQIAFQHPFFRSLLKCLHYLSGSRWESISATQKLIVLSTLKNITDYDVIIYRLFHEEGVMDDLAKEYSYLIEHKCL